MHQRWFYGQEGHRLGPWTAQELRALGFAGKILFTDTVWKEGIDLGVLATSIKELFPLPAMLPGSQTASAEKVAEATVAAEETSAKMEPTNPRPPGPEKKPVRKMRAMAIKGAKISSQDGTTVQIRKICTTCGNEDPARTTMVIRMGKIKIPFYCRKCRRPREVEIQGMS